ncbi:hypothetical protein GH714_034826 [Hevea brasiliensis]|uniref:Uncharacterized protein n=1 Tax=Hevea brasiliensis TaxID=3981 RepID=A0A6A6NAA9_HEVBR|nr:hypothetical protein GH714_034826 [Hevea brasiliensis]
MVDAIKLVEESILTAFVQHVRAEAMSKHDDRLTTSVPKKSRGHRQRQDKKPPSPSFLFLHEKSYWSMNEIKRRIEDSSFLTEDEKSKLKEQKENIPVTLMEPCGDESKILLRQWNLKSSSTYC